MQNTSKCCRIDLSNVRAAVECLAAVKEDGSTQVQVFLDLFSFLLWGWGIHKYGGEKVLAEGGLQFQDTSKTCMIDNCQC